MVGMPSGRASALKRRCLDENIGEPPNAPDQHHEAVPLFRVLVKLAGQRSIARRRPQSSAPDMWD